MRARQDPLVSDVVKASVGVGGLALCITLVFLGMRAVMDVGGACADGGPYVSAQSCPDGSTPALLLGIFGLFLFGGIGAVYGSRLGGIWAAAPLFAWSGLFLALGWNFLDYGLFNPPGDETVIWGWLLCGVIFVAMGLAPLLGGLAVFGAAPVSRVGRPVRRIRGLGRHRRSRAGDGPPARARRGSRGDRDVQPGARLGRGHDAGRRGASRVRRDHGPLDRAPGDRERHGRRHHRGGRGHAGRSAGPGRRRHGATPRRRADAEFSEGTQALLDRLERLADLRDRGLLGQAEYDTAKESVMRELEARS